MMDVDQTPKCRRLGFGRVFTEGTSCSVWFVFYRPVPSRTAFGSGFEADSMTFNLILLFRSDFSYI